MQPKSLPHSFHRLGQSSPPKLVGARIYHIGDLNGRSEGLRTVSVPRSSAKAATAFRGTKTAFSTTLLWPLNSPLVAPLAMSTTRAVCGINQSPITLTTMEYHYVVHAARHKQSPIRTWQGGSDPIFVRFEHFHAVPVCAVHR